MSWSIYLLLVSVWVSLSSIWGSFLLWVVVEVRVGVAFVGGVMFGVVQMKLGQGRGWTSGLSVLKYWGLSNS